MTHSSSRPGYVFLISAVVIGSIAVLGTLTLLLLGWVSEQNGQAHVRANQALENAQTCADRLLGEIHDNDGMTHYPPSGARLLLDQGSCEAWIRAAGNTRDICVDAANDQAIRRLQIKLSALYPAIRVERWDDVECCTGFNPQHVSAACGDA